MIKKYLKNIDISALLVAIYASISSFNQLDFLTGSVSTMISSDTSISSRLYFQWNTIGSSFISAKYL